MALLDVLKTLFPDHAQDVDALGVAGAPGVAGLIQPPVSQDAYAKAPGGRAAPPPPRPIDPHSGLRGILSSPDAWQTIAATLKDMGAGFGGGEGTALDRLEGSRQAGRQAQQAKADQDALRAAVQAQFPNDPKMQLLFMADPKAFATALGKQEEPYTLDQGAARHGGGQDAYNPKTGIDGGHSYTLGADGMAAWGTQRPESYSEAETRLHDRTDEQNAAMRLELETKLGLGNLSLAKQREARTGAHAGGTAGSAHVPTGFVLDSH